METAKAALTAIGSGIQKSFIEGRTILSFDEYLAGFFEHPRAFARSAAQYLRDCFDAYGADEVQLPQGKMRRFRIFDRGQDSASGEGPVFGQETAQNAIYRLLGNFVRSGRSNKLVLLHGPNGSAKTSLIAGIARALEDYSRAADGALYRFNWLFPSEKIAKSSLGFTGKEGAEPMESYAHLDGTQIDARLVCELKDHPLFLIPVAERRELLEKHCDPAQRGGDGGFILSDYLLYGELCQKCRAIYGALLASCNGDYVKLLRHVQVERFYASSRYQQAAVSIEPQLAVDAELRQVTADRSHASLPAALQNLTLFEPVGPLPNGNRGLIEYSDLLKRPLEAFKYLLSTSESGRAMVGPTLLHLDAVLIATSNEKHLQAFKELPDFASFKGRIELVRVPYLRRYSVEKRIYDAQVTRASIGKHIAPYATSVAAMWAVLTRLKKPLPERYKGELRELVDGLTPFEKLGLYDTGEAPDRLAGAQAKELKKHLPDLFNESDTYPNYEGRLGASAREIKSAIYYAAQNADHACLTPLAVLEELGTLVKDKSVYEFLQQEELDGYHQNDEFVRIVEGKYLDKLDEEIRESMGLITEKQYREIFERYILNASHWVKGEKLYNRVTQDYDRPDEDLMVELERVLMPGPNDRREFRRSLISTVGAHRLDHPEGEIDYARIFPDLFRKLRDHYFEEHKKTLHRNRENVLKYLGDERAQLSPKDAAQVESTLAAMTSKYGYCEHCAKDALLFLLRKRYAD